MSNLKGYSDFNDVTNDLLQAWNRAETIVNINDAKGNDSAQEYIDQFTADEQMKIKILLMAVSHHGRDAVYKKVQETLNDVELTDGDA